MVNGNDVIFFCFQVYIVDDDSRHEFLGSLLSAGEIPSEGNHFLKIIFALFNYNFFLEMIIWF